MNFSTVIDRVFDAMLQFSLRCIRAFKKATTEPALDNVPLEENVEEEIEEVVPYTFKTVQDILKTDTYAPPRAFEHTTYYASTHALSVYENPTIEFDTQVGSIPYGEVLVVHEARGRFFRATGGGCTGWVLRDDCSDRTNRVYPEFRVGEEHSVDHPHTAQVRAIIGDEFGVGQSEFPLQAGEYVLYKLWRKGIRITWPPVRPRVPGLWHTILKGAPRVHMGVFPKTGAVMEYMLNDDVGHVAYVEVVFPDDTMSISEAHFPDSGIYNERTLTKEEWKTLKPIFIQFS